MLPKNSGQKGPYLLKTDICFARREHGVTLSYSFVKLALQEAGLVRKGRARGAIAAAASRAPASASCCTWTGAITCG